jgi:hypothetical protein
VVRGPLCLVQWYVSASFEFLVNTAPYLPSFAAGDEGGRARQWAGGRRLWGRRSPKAPLPTPPLTPPPLLSTHMPLPPSSLHSHTSFPCMFSGNRQPKQAEIGSSLFLQQACPPCSLCNGEADARQLPPSLFGAA